MNSSVRVMIINAYGRSNRGDSVLLDECINEIKCIIPNARISGSVFEGVNSINLVHPTVNWSERIGNTNLNGVIGKLLTLFYIFVAIFSTIFFLKPLIYFLPKSQRDTLLEISNSEYIISAPGGYIHDTNFAFYIALLHIWLGLRFKKKVILAPQSIGPIDNNISRLLTKSILEKCTMICARESYTYNFLKNNLKIFNINLVKKTGDSAFWNFDVCEKNNKEINLAKLEIGIDENCTGRILGITVVDWDFPKSDDANIDLDNYIKSMAAIIDYLVSKYQLQPIIYNQVSDDLVIANKVKKLCKSKVLVDKISREPDILRSLISDSTIFLGTRFHSCIFSMMASIPTFAIAYLPKTSYILKDLDLLHRQSSIDEIDIEKIISQFEMDLNNLEAARREISNAVNRYRQNYARLSDVLKEDIV